jgi:hypothetical protein
MGMPKIAVGCKLPNGLHLDHGGKRVTLKGANDSVVVGGHGITEEVDQDFFDAWMQAHQDFQPVKQSLIFAHAKRANVEAEAKEKANNKSGFERLNPDAPAPGIKKAEK